MKDPSRCTDTSDPGHFGPKTLRTYKSSDPGHFGMTEVSRHFGTSAEVFGTSAEVFGTSAEVVSLGHFCTRQSQYLVLLTGKTNHIAYYAKAYPWIAVI